MQLSKLEHRAVTAVENNQLAVFTPKDIQLLLQLSLVQTYNLIKSLKKKKCIQKVGKSRFALSGTDELRIATLVHFPSYISFWSALSYYGFTDQLPRTIFLASSRQHHPTGSFRYVLLKPNLFFGYTAAGNIILAEKEKALLDSLLFPKYSGGIKEIKRCLKSARSQINIPKLIDYALKMDRKVLLRRLGFLLEQEGLPKNKLALLKRNLGQGYEKLDPSLPRKNKWNAYWLLDVNI